MNQLNMRRVLAVSAVLALAVMLGAFSVAQADCSPDGGGGDDNIVCEDPPVDADGVDGGAGDDTITNNGTVLSDISGGDDNDTIINNGTAEDLDGDAGDDTIINNGTAGNDIQGDAGDDTIINNGTEDDGIYGGNDNDTIINNGTAGDDIQGDAGNDTIINNGTAEQDLVGGSGNDTITNNSHVGQQIYGHAGDDTITNTGHVEDVIYGGDGDDTVILGPGSQVDGVVDGGDEDTADTLIFDLEITIGEDEEARTVQALKDLFEAGGGTGTFAGHTFTDFENLIERLHFHIYSGNNLIDCGKDPYLGQRPFNRYCEPYTGDPNETALDGLLYGETGEASS